ncbi:MAG: hypothetical protein LC722_04835 [Actinobacteria bacterium]|nr:hypothetical protein [Actinomycetota bacterium]
MDRASIDTIAVSFEVGEPDSGPGVMMHSSIGESGGLEDVRTLRKLPGGGTLSSGVGGRAKVEASAPKYLSGGNAEGVGFEAAIGVARAMWEEAGQYVRPVRSWEESRVCRVDVVRDFTGVRGFEYLVHGLQPHLRAPRAKGRLFWDRARGGLTLGVGNTRFRAYLYDKGAETGERQDQGRVRFELSLRSKRVREAAVSLQSEGELAEVCRRVFTTTGFGARVSGMGRVLGDVLEAAGLSTSEKYRLLGFMWARTFGAELHESSATRAKYNRLCRDLGVTLAKGDVGAPETFAALDYDGASMALEVVA